MNFLDGPRIDLHDEKSKRHIRRRQDAVQARSRPRPLEGSHLDIAVWIPLSAERGVHCSAHYWGGLDGATRSIEVKPLDGMTRWLDRFCRSVKLAAPAGRWTASGSGPVPRRPSPS